MKIRTLLELYGFVQDISKVPYKELLDMQKKGGKYMINQYEKLIKKSFKDHNNRNYTKYSQLLFDAKREYSVTLFRIEELKKLEGIK